MMVKEEMLPPAEPRQPSGLNNTTLLNRIDKLFECGAGKYVDIPQIVVVGDQSSGKSSVLSSLIGKDLPRDSGLCTRYPTKIIFRRAPESKIQISVIPDPSSSAEHQKRIHAMDKWSAESIEALDFEVVISNVNRKIGINDSTDGSAKGRVFSGDTLQIEIAGPGEDHFSVIDVPGMFRDPEPGKTTQEDMHYVKEMVMTKMRSPRAMMLAVIPANVDLATQEILQLAQQVDREGDRTLGVLTKPDLVDEGAESRVIDLLEGRARELKLGWHVVRNAGQKALGNKDLDRRAHEREFFERREPWKQLSQDCWGTDALKNRVQEILAALAEREFGKLKSDFANKLMEKEELLKGLGPERASRPAQSAFLTERATSYEEVVRNALAATYGLDPRFEDETLRIAPMIMKRTECFSATMQTYGHKYATKPPHRQLEVDFMPPPEYSFNKDEVSIPSGTFRNRLEQDEADLMQALTLDAELYLRKAIESDYWLERLYEINRGFELGTFNYTIIASAMREQTQKWPQMALAYTRDVIVAIHKFIRKALKVVCANERLELQIYYHIENELLSRYKSAVEQVNFLLLVELESQPLTMNVKFAKNLKISQTARSTTLQENPSARPQQRWEAIESRSVDNREDSIQRVGDIFRAYYDVARDRFVDNMLKQAINYHLVTGPKSPLKVFNPVMISQMNDQQLSDIAGEESQSRRQREKLNKDINNLMKIRDILKS